MYEEAPRVEFQIRHCFRPPGGELFEVHAAVVRRMPEDLNLVCFLPNSSSSLLSSALILLFSLSFLYRERRMMCF